MKTILEIVAEHLRDGGFGGLVQGDAQCGCELSDLNPCGETFATCKPAYKHYDPRQGRGGEWAMFLTSDIPTLEEWDRVEY